MGKKPIKKGRADKTDTEAAQDMKFAEAMQRDMEKYSRDMDNRRSVDEDWKNHMRYDGNKNLELANTEFGRDEGAARNDTAFVDKMFMPYLGSGFGPVPSIYSDTHGMNSEFSDEIEAAQTNAELRPKKYNGSLRSPHSSSKESRRGSNKGTDQNE